MPIYWGDFLRDTLHLNAEQVGAYLLLIASYWCRGAPLPDDDKQLARVARVSIFKWKGMSEILRPFFLISNGAWIHERLESELLRSSDRSAKASASAKQRARVSQSQSQRTLLVGNIEPHIEDLRPNGKIVISGEENRPENDPIPPDEIKPAIDAWNEWAPRHGLARCRKPTTARKAATRRRLDDCGGLPGWFHALAKAEAIPWMFGENERGWRLNIDTFIRESFFTRLMEGAYDPGGPDGGGESLFDELERKRHERPDHL